MKELFEVLSGFPMSDPLSISFLALLPLKNLSLFSRRKVKKSMSSIDSLESVTSISRVTINSKSKSSKISLSSLKVSTLKRYQKLKIGFMSMLGTNLNGKPLEF